MDSYQIAWGSSRFFSFYDLTYTPTVVFDGTDIYVGTTNYESIYQARAGVSTDVTIELTADPAGTQTTQIHANVCLEGGGSSKTVRVYIAQVLDYYPPPAVKPNQRNCLMQVAPTQDVPLTPGTCGEVVRSLTFSSTSWANQDDIKIIAWAQHNRYPGPANIYQAAIMPWPFTPHDFQCDFDDDHDVDGDDATAFLACYSGPGIPHAPGCEEGDTEPDGDVDCDDWAVLKSGWTGPPEYPTFYATCDSDCNINTVADEWDLDAGVSEDCNANELPDECEIDLAGGPAYYCDPAAPPPPLASCDPDCNANGIPDECDVAGSTSEDCNENVIPDDCDILFGTSEDLNTNDIPDECEILPPLPEDCGMSCETATVPCVDDGDCEGQAKCLDGVCYAPKHRYISIVRNPEQVANTARRIKLYPSGDIVGWVGVPDDIDPTPQHDGMWLADVVAAPVYEGIDFVGNWPDLLQVSGCEISTGRTYEVQAIAYTWPIGEERFYSDELALHTSPVWGDTVGSCAGNWCRPPDEVAGLSDVQGAIKKYQSVDVAPITWLDIHPSLGGQTPDQNIGVGDILACIDGFQMGVYPGPAPLDCSP